ncbi:MAG: hypothetical protein M3N28_08545 [Actinomycetota bacterium]|nr:hypothetical protein [Actinomycetota bacterium]
MGSGRAADLAPDRVNELEADVRNTDRTAGGGQAGRAQVAGEVVGGVVLLLFTLFFLLKDGARMAEWHRARIPSAYQDDAVVASSKTS